MRHRILAGGATLTGARVRVPPEPHPEALDEALAAERAKGEA